MMARRTELALVAALTLACYLLLEVAHVPWAPARALFALALTLVVPGYALLAALYPGRPIGIAVRAGLSLGLSLSMTVLVGLGLAATPGGARPDVYAAVLAGLSLLLLVSAMGRSTSERSAQPWFVIPRWRSMVLLVLAALVAVFAVHIDVSAAHEATSQQDFTELWLLPPAQGATSTVVGVKNLEGRQVTYQLTLSLAQRPVASWNDLEVPANGTWTHTVDIPGGASPGRLTATLTKVGDNSAILRSPLRVWIHVGGK